MMLSPKAAALSDRGFCQRSTIALPVPYVALISSEGIVPSSNAPRYISYLYGDNVSGENECGIRRRTVSLSEFASNRISFAIRDCDFESS